VDKNTTTAINMTSTITCRPISLMNKDAKIFKKLVE
jgi:hypothetical protein